MTCLNLMDYTNYVVSGLRLWFISGQSSLLYTLFASENLIFDVLPPVFSVKYLFHWLLYEETVSLFVAFWKQTDVAVFSSINEWRLRGREIKLL